MTITVIDTVTEYTEADPEGGAYFTVWAVFQAEGLVRDKSHGICVRSKKVAERLAHAIKEGVVFTDLTLKTDVHGFTYVGYSSKVSAKYANADLIRLGF